jgi:DNA repair protein RadC
MNIKQLPLEERPREKLIKNGPQAMTNSELLAIILRTGSKKENVLNISNKLLSNYNIKSLSTLKITKLKKQLGIGDAKACQIMACFELGRRLSAFKEEKKIAIKNAKDLAKLFISDMGSLEKEHFKGVYLDSGKRIIKHETIFIGSLNESVVHPREIFKIALNENAAAVIILHNHPSGNPNPSSFDLEITKELVKAGDFMGIPVLDHIIIGGNKYISLKEKGLI